MRSTLVTIIASALLAAPVMAQRPSDSGRSQGKGRDSIPEAYQPPAGMCRIWVDNVPPAQQPAPTDCASAIRNRPQNGRVVFGDDYARRGAKPAEKKPGSVLKGFLGGKDAADWRHDDKAKPPKKP